jgi:uncharacterized membrane-anchored protein
MPQLLVYYNILLYTTTALLVIFWLPSTLNFVLTPIFDTIIGLMVFLIWEIGTLFM